MDQITIVYQQLTYEILYGIIIATILLYVLPVWLGKGRRKKDSY